LLRFSLEHREREKRMERAAWRVRVGLGIAMAGLMLAACGSVSSAKAGPAGSSTFLGIPRRSAASLASARRSPAVVPFSSLAPLDLAGRVRAGFDAVVVAQGGREAFGCVASGGILLRRIDGVSAVLGTKSLRPILASAGLHAGSSPRCVGLGVDPGEPGVVFAAFAVRDATGARGGRGVVGAWTTDGGRRWAGIAPPPGAAVDALVRFVRSGGLLRAVYAPSEGDVPVVEATAGSVDLWASSGPACLANGVCVTFGVPEGQGCRATVPVLRSDSGGTTWHRAALPLEVRACSRTSLVPDGQKAVLLVDPDAQRPLWVSQNTGRRWVPVALPPLPQALMDIRGGSERWHALHLLGRGGLLLASPGQWELLQPGARRWCRVSIAVPSGTIPSSARVSNGALVFESGSRLRTVSVTSLRCAPASSKAQSG